MIDKPLLVPILDREMRLRSTEPPLLPNRCYARCFFISRIVFIITINKNMQKSPSKAQKITILFFTMSIIFESTSDCPFIRFNKSLSKYISRPKKYNRKVHERKRTMLLIKLLNLSLNCLKVFMINRREVVVTISDNLGVIHIV